MCRWSNGPSPRAWGLLLLAFLLGPEGGPSPRAWGLLLALLTGGYAYGPSPRAWGLRMANPVGYSGSRSIPTGVGTTTQYGTTVRGRTVHPHGRGDYFTTLNSGTFSTGPSPRAWGLRAPRRLGLGGKRSIPTGVGTTFSASPKRSALAVHPHGRGDYASPRRPEGRGRGPSPRAWGLPRGSSSPPPPPRSIPTGVGTTSSFLGILNLRTVHPHGRGDYGLVNPTSTSIVGPSPRAWGLRERAPKMGPPRRSIPTGVGTTTGLPSTAFWRRSIPTGVGTTWPEARNGKRGAVHPHGRGDYPEAEEVAPGRLGPSPRAWGLREGHHGLGGLTRSIPTGVGTTRSAIRRSSSMAVHPHGRGDYT